MRNKTKFSIIVWNNKDISFIFAITKKSVIFTQMFGIQMETTTNTQKNIRSLFDNTMSMRKRWTAAVRQNATREEMEKMGIKQIAIVK